MAMSVGSSSGEADVMVEMNTTPLIDVMLVLLVMIIVTIPVQKQAVQKQAQQKPLVVMMTGFGSVDGGFIVVPVRDAQSLLRLGNAITGFGFDGSSVASSFAIFPPGWSKREVPYTTCTYRSLSQS
mgnify:CR=1 FL=1